MLNIVTSCQMSRHDAEADLQACSVLHKANPVFFHQEALNACAGKTVGRLYAPDLLSSAVLNMLCV